MTAHTFEKRLRALMQRRPFESFQVELFDGKRLWIDTPQAIGFNSGAAAFIAADGSVHFFNNEQVRALGGGNGPSP
jgi:hypothetical protein